MFLTFLKVISILYVAGDSRTRQKQLVEFAMLKSDSSTVENSSRSVENHSAIYSPKMVIVMFTNKSIIGLVIKVNWYSVIVRRFCSQLIIDR